MADKPPRKRCRRSPARPSSTRRTSYRSERAREPNGAVADQARRLEKPHFTGITLARIGPFPGLPKLR